MTMPRMSPDQILAARAHAQGLGPDRTPDAVLSLGVQDTPYGSAREALATRIGGDPREVDCELVWSLRGAPHLHRAEDLRSLAAALWPADDADATARIGSRVKEGAKRGVAAFTAVAEAFRDVVTERRSKGDVSAGVTRSIPDDLAYDCPPCKSRHVSGGIFQLAGLAGGVRIVLEGRKTFLEPLPEDRRPDVPTRMDGATAVLSRYLEVLGPATSTELASLLGTKPRVVDANQDAGWVEVEGPKGRAWSTEAFMSLTAEAEQTSAAHLLPPGDPWLQSRDRDLIVPEKAHQKALWKPLGSPGAVLVGTTIVGTWRAQSAGRRRLSVSVETFGPPPKGLASRLEEQAGLIASVRGLDEATVTVA